MAPRTTPRKQALGVCGVLALVALTTLAGSAFALSSGGHSVPTYINFCNQSEITFEVQVCNTNEPGSPMAWYGVSLKPGTFQGCTETFQPQWTHSPVFYGRESGAVSVDILDLRGRVVRRLVDGEHLGSGEHSRRWDGRDDRGASVASGIYTIRFRTSEREAMMKATLMK